MFVYDFCVRRKKQRTVIYFSGLLVSVVHVVIIDIWWLVFNVFSLKESWMYSLLNVLACCLTTKAITENRHIFCPLESVRSENSSYFAESKYKLFISRYYHSWRHYSQLTDFSVWKLNPIYYFLDTHSCEITDKSCTHILQELFPLANCQAKLSFLLVLKSSLPFQCVIK